MNSLTIEQQSELKLDMNYVYIGKIGGQVVGCVNASNAYRVYGNTYPIRETLKEKGFKWHSVMNRWEGEDFQSVERASFAERLEFWRYMQAKHDVGVYHYFDEIVQEAAQRETITDSDRKRWQITISTRAVLNEVMDWQDAKALNAIAHQMIEADRNR